MLKDRLNAFHSVIETFNTLTNAVESLSDGLGYYNHIIYNSPGPILLKHGLTRRISYI